jgi:uncharacterized protein
MSLTVTPDVLEAAEAGRLSDEAFVACVQESLPYAYDVVERLARQLPAAVAAGASFAVDDTVPPDDAAFGQLLRAFASTSIRGALERRFGVALAFQNCHRVGAFPPAGREGDAYRRFTSPESQIRNQRPDLVNC